MRIERCNFCSGPVYPGHGIQFVRNDCKLFKFCRSKCHKHFKNKKNPRKTKWTKAYRRAANKELGIDPSFELEKRRHCPTKYSRSLWQQTQEAMKKILDISQRRTQHFAKIRARRAQKIKDAHDRREVQRDLSVIKSPASNMNIKDLIRTRIKPRVEVIRSEDVEIDEEDQYNYSEEEAEAEKEMEMELA